MGENSLCSAEPDGCNIHRCPHAVLLGFLDDTLFHTYVGIGLLKLYGYTLCNRQTLVITRFEDLHHNDVRVTHRAVIDDIFLTHQRVTLVFQKVILLGGRHYLHSL